MNTSIKDKFGPCGIFCEKCFAFSDGTIKQNSISLENALGNFGIYAERFSKLLNEPAFIEYPNFKRLLHYFATVECRGCRKEPCKLFENCKVRDCYKTKGVDFCFQCSEFPCNDTGFDEHLNKRFIQINLRIKKIGIEKYYNEVKDKPRY